MNLSRMYGFRCALLAILCLCAGGANAALTGASVSPVQRQLNAQGNNSIPLSWRVSADSTHRVGTSSGPATLLNGTTGDPLGSTGLSFSTGGPGPYTFSEVLNISAAQVSNWQSMGIGEVHAVRTFSDPATGGSVSVTLRLRVPPRGDFTAARVSPAQQRLFANRNGNLDLNWQVTTGPNHRNGIVSPPARILDPRNGRALATLGDTLSDSGSGPFLFSEQLQLETATLQGLLARGLKRVVLERSFSDPVGGGGTAANLVLIIDNSALSATRGAAPGTLAVTGLNLEFDTGNDLALANFNQALQARLTLSYTGSGLLEGRWLLAEPGGTEAPPLYRTLALVRRNITANQRVVLHSPRLPTQRAGKYRLRFCVTSRDPVPGDEIADAQCPLRKQLVDAAYQVQGSRRAGEVAIVRLSPNRQVVDGSTPFAWQPVPDTQVYQVQLFALQAADTRPPSSRAQGEVMEPKFITGMLLPAGITRTPLSDLVRSKLEADRHYLWRITAHDQSGRLIGSSGEYRFVYRAQE